MFVTVIVGALGFLAARAGLVFLRKRTFATYWRNGLTATASPGALRVVVLGDSVSQGVGANKIEHSLIGRVDAYLQEETGREVAVKNYSRSGATAKDVMEHQLPHADFDSADIILLEIGANDTRRLTPGDYGRYAGEVIHELPLEKTVIADVPHVRGRELYQKELNKVLGGKSVAHARFVPELLQAPAWKVTAGDFFHPNDRGYELWFRSFKPGIDQVLQRRSLLKEDKE